jgi:hypothetical protein
MRDDPFTKRPMTDLERRELLRKAKADTLAWKAAELLQAGQTSQAAGLVAEGVKLSGPESFGHRLRHYALAKFKVDRQTLAEFLADGFEGRVAA